MRQFIDRRVKLKVWREKFCCAWIDESVGLSDGDVGNASDIADFWGEKTSKNLKHVEYVYILNKLSG